MWSDAAERPFCADNARLSARAPAAMMTAVAHEGREVA